MGFELEAEDEMTGGAGLAGLFKEIAYVGDNTFFKQHKLTTYSNIQNSILCMTT